MIWEIDEKSETIEGLDESGRPDPAYAAALGLLPAPLGRRALAALFDGVALVLVQLPFLIGSVPLLMKLATGSISAYGLVNHPGFVLAVVMASITTVLTLALAIVQWSLHAVKGLTIGKALTGIKVVREADGSTLGGGVGLVRSLVLWTLSGMTAGLFFVLSVLWPLGDAKKQALHDKIVGASVIAGEPKKSLGKDIFRP